MVCVEPECEGTSSDKCGEEDFAHTAGMISDNWRQSDASSRRFEPIDIAVRVCQCGFDAA